MSSTAADLTRPDGSPLRVLVVDDEVNIAELISMALRYEGWQVQMAHSGSSAVQGARDLEPDAVVLDMMLPDIDGLEVLRRMRATLPDVPASSFVVKGGTWYLGTDLGVLTSTDAGATWKRMAGFPYVTVMQLRLGPDGQVYAATHGRGIWRVSA